jgi:hypothetical protein
MDGAVEPLAVPIPLTNNAGSGETFVRERPDFVRFIFNQQLPRGVGGVLVGPFSVWRSRDGVWCSLLRGIGSRPCDRLGNLRSDLGQETYEYHEQGESDKIGLQDGVPFRNECKNELLR